MNKCIVIVIFFSLLIAYSSLNRENFRMIMPGRTKCFSCEQDMVNRYGYHHSYMGRPTKCFSCERDIINRMGIERVNLGQPTKCLSCDSGLV